MGDPGQWNKGRFYFNGEYWISDYTHSYINGMMRLLFICTCITKRKQNITYFKSVGLYNVICNIDLDHIGNMVVSELCQ